MMRTGLRALAALMMFSAINGCEPDYDDIKWNPDFYVGDWQNSQIINEAGKTVSASDSEFNEFGCLHEKKIIELRDLLKRAKIPRNLGVNQLNGVLNRL